MTTAQETGAAGDTGATAPLLELRDLRVRYHRGSRPVDAVRGVSLALRRGDTVGLAGESGCGKSTLAMSVLRLLPRTAEITGEVLLDGEDVNTMGWGRLRAVRWAGASVVFQGAMHALNPVRKISEQIAEPIRLHADSPLSTSEVDDQVRSLLRQVELPTERADAYPHELSGGQKQRVMIAMALACSPDLVIADEPTTALDVVVQAQVLELLGQLVAERNVGLLMISHDLSVLASACKRLVVMYAGEIVEDGESATVIERPQHPHTAQLAAAFPTIGDPADRLTTTAAATADSDDSVEDSDDALLRTAGLRVEFTDRYGHRVHAVRDVDLSVWRNEIVALVGQSGSGKTTLARTILGLQQPTAGTVYFDGTPLPATSAGLREYRRQAQLVLQDPTGALNPRHSVYESVAEGLRIHKVPGNEAELVADALSRAELRPPEEFFELMPHELSGGQRQRVVIAGALALAPRLLVADEPVASLDASVRGEILALLLRLRRELGLAGLVITHDLGLAWNIADRVAVMYQGEIVESGTVEQVLLDPSHEYTKTLLAAVPSTSRYTVGSA